MKSAGDFFIIDFTFIKHSPKSHSDGRIALNCNKTRRIDKKNITTPRADASPKLPLANPS